MTGAGHWFPETVLDNSFFDQLDIDSSAAWIEERTGIRERRTVLARNDVIALRRHAVTRNQLVSRQAIPSIPAMSAAPWKMAEQRSNLRARGTVVDTVLAGTSVPDDDIPAHACSIAAHNAIECTAGFDINSACSTFAVHLHNARALIRSGAARNVASFICERYTTRIDYADRKTCILFGDSAAATIIEALPADAASSGKISGLEIVDTIVHSQPSGARHISMPDGAWFHQDGQAVQKFAIQKTIQATEEILTRNGMQPTDLSWFIGHQANLRMLTYAAEKLGLEPEQHLHNVESRGNQGGAGAPGVLSSNWDKFKPGDLIAIAVVGSGLTWGSALLRRIY